ncbi:MAG TPA: hypothetical protein VD999_01980 [Vitreimonas sp.]|nr:hypothetical protein [Vitreimonas sp.]
MSFLPEHHEYLERHYTTFLEGMISNEPLLKLSSRVAKAFLGDVGDVYDVSDFSDVSSDELLSIASNLKQRLITLKRNIDRMSEADFKAEYEVCLALNLYLLVIGSEMTLFSDIEDEVGESDDEILDVANFLPENSQVKKVENLSPFFYGLVYVEYLSRGKSLSAFIYGGEKLNLLPASGKVLKFLIDKHPLSSSPMELCQEFNVSRQTIAQTYIPDIRNALRELDISALFPRDQGWNTYRVYSQDEVNRDEGDQQISALDK